MTVSHSAVVGDHRHGSPTSLFMALKTLPPKSDDGQYPQDQGVEPDQAGCNLDTDGGRQSSPLGRWRTVSSCRRLFWAESREYTFRTWPSPKHVQRLVRRPDFRLDFNRRWELFQRDTERSDGSGRCDLIGCGFRGRNSPELGDWSAIKSCG